jgi:Zn-dependent metalloprotease
VIAAVVSLALAAAPSFRADFPDAVVVESPAGGRLIQASGFSASGLGSSPGAAAHAFLVRYGAAFGIGARQRLVPKDPQAQASAPVAIRFERRIDGLPVFDADVVVGVDGKGAVFLVNVADVPPRVSGRTVLSRKAAIRSATAAIPGLSHPGPPMAEQGWRATGDVLRPAWRIDFTAAQPPGDWRTYVDAETGKVLLRVNRRAATHGLAGRTNSPTRPTTSGSIPR